MIPFGNLPGQAIGFDRLCLLETGGGCFGEKIGAWRTSCIALFPGLYAGYRCLECIDANAPRNHPRCAMAGGTGQT